VQAVKAFQRQSAGHKEAWYHFVQTRGTTNFDPNRHDTELLQEFVTAANDGQIEIPEVTGKGSGKSWGKGSSSWGKGSGSSWGGSSGGDSWGGGGGGGKGDWGADPWKMMQTMMEWFGGADKGWGKGGSSGGKGGSGSWGGDAGGAPQAKPGDWVCPSCSNVNFSNRDTCNRCGSGGRDNQQRLGMRPGDWICPGCGDLVFASKSACKMCGTAKQGEAGGNRWSPY